MGVVYINESEAIFKKLDESIKIISKNNKTLLNYAIGVIKEKLKLKCKNC